MQRKTIRKRITKKVDDWIESIEDAELRKDLLDKDKDEVIVSGGCITSMLLGEDPNDYDIYFRTLEMTERVARYYQDQFHDLAGQSYEVLYRSNDLVLSDGSLGYGDPETLDILVERAPYNPKDIQCVYLKIPSSGYIKVDKAKLKGNPETGKNEVESGSKIPYQPVFASGNAITLTDGIQLIVRFSGTPEEVQSNFDFAHTRMHWTRKEGVVTNNLSLECLLARRLIYVGSKYPICSVMRSKKFLQRFHADGKRWSMDVGQYLKMIAQASQLNLRDPSVMFDQLCGVDTAYFHWVIEACCKEGDGLTSEGELDLGYFLEMVNTVFDGENDSSWGADEEQDDD